jgi:hypothetical protein
MRWRLSESIGPKTGFTFQIDDALYVDNRGMIFFLAFGAPKKLGVATFYVVGGHDSHGQPLSGENAYRWFGLRAAISGIVGMKLGSDFGPDNVTMNAVHPDAC